MNACMNEVVQGSKVLTLYKIPVTGTQLTKELPFRPCQRRLEHLPTKLKPMITKKSWIFNEFLEMFKGNDTYQVNSQTLT